MITASDIAKRYGLSKAAALNFVRANIEVINKDGKNAYQDGSKNSWYFTDKAVKIMDELRHVDSVVVEYTENLEEKAALLQEISTLKTKIAGIQQEYLLLQDRHIKDKDLLYGQLLESRELAHKAEIQLLESKSQREAAEEREKAMETKIKELNDEIISAREREKAAREREQFLEARASELEKAREETQRRLEAEQSRSILQRIFGRRR